MTFEGITDKLKTANVYGLLLTAGVAAALTWGIGLRLAAQYPDKKWIKYVPGLVGVVIGLAMMKGKESGGYGMAFAGGSAAGAFVLGVQTSPLGAKFAGGK